MKSKHLLIAMLCLISISLNAQTYEFSVSTETYEDLTGSTSLNNGTTWDDPEYYIPIGFDFQFFDTLVTQILIESEGYGGLLSFNESESIVPTIIAYGADIIDRGYDFLGGYGQASQSNISYLLEGTAGSRILKIEWNNVGFYEEMADNYISVDYTNFQLWLYEGSNNIEIRFGPNSVTQPNLCYDGAPGSFAGLVENVDYSTGFFYGEVIMLLDDPSAPMAVSTPSYYNIPYLNGTIPDGTVYKFEYTTVNTSDVTEFDGQFSLSPNPSNDYFKIILNDFNTNFVNANILIVNSLGQVLKDIDFTTDAINISDLKAGTYFVQIRTDSGMTTKKLIKKK